MAWLGDLRRSAAQTAESLGLPSRTDEQWRRTDLARLDLNAFQTAAPSSPELPRSQWPATLQVALDEQASPAEGVLLHSNNSVLYLTQKAASAQKGVLFMDLESASLKHPELVQRALGQYVKPAENKFTALNAAHWRGGTFIHVPANVQVEVPFHVLTWSDRPGLALYPRLLILAEKNASVSLIDEYQSADQESSGFSSGVSEIWLDEGAELRYYYIQQWGKSVFNFMTQRIHLSKDSKLTNVGLNVGGQLSRVQTDVLLKESGASSKQYGLILGDGEQRFEVLTLQDHQAPHTESDLLYKSALKDKSRSFYSGLIQIEKEAQQSNAYQVNRNLLLSPKTRADSIPKLEIRANDVRCSHGSATGPIDEDQCFYLMSRGFSRPDAERLIVEGFFEEILSRIPQAAIHERLRQALIQKAI